jgi:adenosine deaminase
MNFITLPKIDLHCHLDGSLRPETVLEIATNENLNIPFNTIEKITNALIAPRECASLDAYLKSFEIPIAVMQTKENLKRVAYELLEDASKENIKYIEVRFAPLLHTFKGLKIDEIIESVLSGIKAGEERFDIKGNLILCCMRNMSSKAAYDIVEAGKRFLQKGVVAIDLCASEIEGFSRKFIKPISLAKEYGYNVTIHAGETGIGKNVLEAIELLGADRIGHGVFINNCIEAYDIVKANGVTLEMCPTSNLQTKAVDALYNHPIYNFYKDEIKVTLNTDNRTVSNTTLTHEFDSVFNEFKMAHEDYVKLYLNSVDASFVSADIKNELRLYIYNS